MGDTLLINVASLGKEGVVQLLLDTGADIEATNKVTYSYANKLHE